MALAPEVRVSQAGNVVVSEPTDAPELRATQAGLMTVAIWPADFINVSQAQVLTVSATDKEIQVSQLGMMVVAKGRVEDPKVRAWTFTLDGHDYYVLRLGNSETLVYDVYAEQWYTWGSSESALWRAHCGRNWLGGRNFSLYTNVIVGDDGNGALYFLDPDGFADDDALAGSEIQRPFLREITGQIPMRGYDAKSCYGVSLMGSIGEVDTTLTGVTLFTSDDDGHSYDDQGTLDVTPGEYQTRLDWNSGLGSFTAPGRLFIVRDYGALQRVDWLDMATDED